MKRIFLVLVLFIPVLLLSQRRPKIKGNRSVTEVNEVLPPFKAIELRDNLNVEIKKSFGEGYEITADDNLIDVLKFEVMDSTLVISSFYDIVSKKKLDITVNYTELAALTVKDGKIFSNGQIASDVLYINTFGNAELDIDASGFMVDVNVENNSKIDLNLDVDSLNVAMNNKADGLIYAVSGSKNISLSDNASLVLEGSTESSRVNMTGSTKLRADKLEAAEVFLSTGESGFARINAYRTFTLQSKGTSKTYLYGNPKITIEEFFDTAQLLKKED